MPFVKEEDSDDWDSDENKKKTGYPTTPIPSKICFILYHIDKYMKNQRLILRKKMKILMIGIVMKM